MFWDVNGGGKQTGGYQSSKDFFFEISVNTAARGSIVWKVEDKTTIWFFLRLKAVCYQQLQYFKLVILIYVYSISTSHVCLWYHSVLSLFSTLLMFVMISFMNYANILYIIVDLCWFRFCWCMSYCKIDDWHHNICDICVHCMILFNLWISFEYFQDY